MRSRVAAHWPLKLRLTLVLNILFWTGYATLGRHAFFPLRHPPRLWLDTAIPYRPDPWGLIYLSQFLFAGTLPWLLVTREELRRYVTGLTLLTLVSFGLFFFWPVASPRPIEVDATGSMAVILGYDGTLNAFPSLHAGFLVFTAGLAWRLFGRGHGIALTAVAITWGGAILYATIATRQHYAVDLVAGAALGALAGWFAWRRSPSIDAATTIARSKAVASHDGCR